MNVYIILWRDSTLLTSNGCDLCFLRQEYPHPTPTNHIHHPAVMHAQLIHNNTYQVLALMSEQCAIKMESHWFQ